MNANEISIFSRCNDDDLNECWDFGEIEDGFVGILQDNALSYRLAKDDGTMYVVAKFEQYLNCWTSALRGVYALCGGKGEKFVRALWYSVADRYEEDSEDGAPVLTKKDWDAANAEAGTRYKMLRFI